jgi:hypothetical protein
LRVDGLTGEAPGRPLRRISARKVANGVGLLVGGLGDGLAEEFGDALLHFMLAVQARGAGFVTGKTGGIVGFGDRLSGETGLGEGFVLGVREDAHGKFAVVGDRLPWFAMAMVAAQRGRG